MDLIFKIALLISLCIAQVEMLSSWNGYEEGGRIYFYTAANQKGQAYVLDLGFYGQCFRIDPNNPPGLTSIDTNGACIYAFSDDSCNFSETWKKLRRFQYESNDLNVIGLAGAIQSVRSCSAYLVPVYLYTQSNFQGDRLRLDIFARSGCKNIPKASRNRATQSVLLNDYASCVILYAGLNCRGTAIRVQSSCSGTAKDLRTVQFTKQVSSLQTCKAAHEIHAKNANSNNTLQYDEADETELKFKMIDSTTNYIDEEIDD